MISYAITATPVTPGTTGQRSFFTDLERHDPREPERRGGFLQPPAWIMRFLRRENYGITTAHARRIDCAPARFATIKLDAQSSEEPQNAAYRVRPDSTIYPSMYICRECENEINQGTEICPHCGADLTAQFPAPMLLRQNRACGKF